MSRGYIKYFRHSRYKHSKADYYCHASSFHSDENNVVTSPCRCFHLVSFCSVQPSAGPTPSHSYPGNTKSIRVLHILAMDRLRTSYTHNGQHCALPWPLVGTSRLTSSTIQGATPPTTTTTYTHYFSIPLFFSCLCSSCLFRLSIVILQCFRSLHNPVLWYFLSVVRVFFFSRTYCDHMASSDEFRFSLSWVYLLFALR